MQTCQVEPFHNLRVTVKTRMQEHGSRSNTLLHRCSIECIKGAIVEALKILAFLHGDIHVENKRSLGGSSDVPESHNSQCCDILCVNYFHVDCLCFTGLKLQKPGASRTQSRQPCDIISIVSDSSGFK